MDEPPSLTRRSKKVRNVNSFKSLLVKNKMLFHWFHLFKGATTIMNHPLPMNQVPTNDCCNIDKIHTYEQLIIVYRPEC